MSMEQKPIFQTFALSKYYKEFKAVNAVSMTIYEGDIYGFVGENGAGKTTLIRLACGLIHETGGSYALFGIPNTSQEISEAKRKTAAIVEAVAINKGLSAIDNLRQQCLLAGIEKSESELNKLLADVGLDPKAIQKKRVGSFSLYFVAFHINLDFADRILQFIERNSTHNALAHNTSCKTHILEKGIVFRKFLQNLLTGGIHFIKRCRISIYTKICKIIEFFSTDNFLFWKFVGHNILLYEKWGGKDTTKFVKFNKLKIKS